MYTIKECEALARKAKTVLVKTDGISPTKALIRARKHIKKAKAIKAEPKAQRVGFHTNEAMKALFNAGM